MANIQPKKEPLKHFLFKIIIFNVLCFNQLFTHNCMVPNTDFKWLWLERNCDAFIEDDYTDKRIR